MRCILNHYPAKLTFVRGTGATRGSRRGAEAADDPLGSPADLGLVDAQCLRDRGRRLAVEEHREHGEVGIVESRDRGLEDVTRDLRHDGLAGGDPPHGPEQGGDRLGLVDDPVGLRRPRGQRQRRPRVCRVDDHRRRSRAGLDAAAVREPVVAREVMVEDQDVGAEAAELAGELGRAFGDGGDREIGLGVHEPAQPGEHGGVIV
jgi:hypothetical protein